MAPWLSYIRLALYVVLSCQKPWRTAWLNAVQVIILAFEKPLILRLMWTLEWEMLLVTEIIASLEELLCRTQIYWYLRQLHHAFKMKLFCLANKDVTCSSSQNKFQLKDAFLLAIVNDCNNVLRLQGFFDRFMLLFKYRREVLWPVV